MSTIDVAAVDLALTLLSTIDIEFAGLLPGLGSADYESPSGTIWTFGAERFTSVEALFNPELALKQGVGIADAVVSAISALGVLGYDFKKQFLNNIVLAGKYSSA